MPQKLPFRDDLGCFVKTVEYDFATRRGRLVMGDRSCTDMSACIALFKAIDPKVEIICTFAGERADTIYALRNREWEAFMVVADPNDAMRGISAAELAKFT